MHHLQQSSTENNIFKKVKNINTVIETNSYFRREFSSNNKYFSIYFVIFVAKLRFPKQFCFIAKVNHFLRLYNVLINNVIEKLFQCLPHKCDRTYVHFSSTYVDINCQEATVSKCLHVHDQFINIAQK